MLTEIYGRIPTVPEYYQLMIDKDANLYNEPKQPCPFHRENTPSFSYSREKDVWRCFGACKCGGDVIDLHRKKFNLKSREEAKKSIKAMFHVYERPVTKVQDVSLLVDDTVVESESYYQKACILANNPARWIELDYIMSVYPLDVTSLIELVQKWEEERER